MLMMLIVRKEEIRVYSYVHCDVHGRLITVHHQIVIKDTQIPS